MKNGKKNEKNAMNITHLKKIFPEDDVVAVEDVSLSLKKGEIFSLLGPNGAGKTTIINIASTSMKPTSGSVEIFGCDILQETGLVREFIGICPQDLVFYENLTILENLIYFGQMNEIPERKLRSYAKELITKVGLEEKSNKLSSRLSGGMKRRLNFILSLINDPDFLFLDEPTAGLDPQTRRLVWNFILDLKKKGKTIFLTTHYMEEADYLSDKIAIIDNGKVIAYGSPFDLKRDYSNGDLIEFKFSEADEFVNSKLNHMNGNGFFEDYNYIEEDSLFRISIHDSLTSIVSILNHIKQLDLHVSDMNIKTNTLENVFINLTGRNLRN